MKACNFIKEVLQHRCVPVNIPKVLGAAFFIEQLQWVLLHYVLVSGKNFKKNKVRGEIAFAIISLFHAQMYEPESMSTTTTAFVFLQNLLNFIITKYLKQGVDDDLKDLSMSLGQKVITLLPPIEKCSTSIKLFLLPKFDSSSSSVTRDKEIYQSHVIMR